MNKKVLITMCLAAVVFLSGVLAIVISNELSRFKPVSGVPASDIRATVSGNGGNAVAVGDYLYYVGNYVDTAEIKYKQNEYNKVEFGSIYRIKLVNGKPNYEDSEKPYRAENVELVVPKIAGFANASLYIFDDTLIYSSPNNMKNRLGQLQTNKVDFFRVNLNGSGHKLIYTTANDFVAREDWTVVSIDSTITLLVHDGTKLVRVDVNGSKAGKINTITENAQSFALPVISSYYASGDGSLVNSYSGLMSYVYYTEALDEEDAEKGLKGNQLKRYSIITGKNDETCLAKIPNTTYRVLAQGNGILMYALGDKDGANNNVYLTKSESKIGDINDKLANVYNSDLTEKYYLPTEARGSVSIRFVGYADNKAFIYREDNGYNFTTINDVSQLLSITASHIYYLTSQSDQSAVKVIDYASQQVGLISAPQNMVSQIKISMFTSSAIGGERYIYIKTFTEGENTTNCAVMVDFTTGEEPIEYVLGVIEDDYLPEDMKTEQED